MRIGVTHTLDQAAPLLQRLPAQGDTALSTAMNTTVRRAQFDVIAEMRNVFDRPTPYALGGLRIEAASPTRLDAAVMVRGKPDVSGAGIPAESFLRAEIEGGARRQKKSEVALQKAGVLPMGWRTVPGQGARLDGFGNMSRGQIVQILSYFQAFPVDKGYRANSTVATRTRLKKGTKRKLGFEYIAVAPGVKGLRPGVWERVALGAGRGVRPILLFVKATAYRKRLDFFGVVNRSVDANLGTQFDRELSKAIA